jgi:uncharacterized protein (DUF885 family)
LLHAETALRQLDGIGELIDRAVAEADQSGQLAAEMRAAAESAQGALAEFRRALRDEITPRAVGDGRLGPQLFADKFRHVLATDLPLDELHARARTDFAVVRAEMRRLAGELWPLWLGSRAMPDDDDQVVGLVLDAISREHRQPDELIEWSQAEVGRIEDFCRERALIGLPDEPLMISWTPVFMRAYGRAFLDSPGPLDKGQQSYFWITPPDESAGEEAAESYLREDNDRMLRLLCIHEGVPGHHLQLAYANRSASLARAAFGSGVFAEGWAVYVTQVMVDAGYGADDPALLLIHWKFYLRAIINTLIDIGIHTAAMTEQEALRLMVAGGWQEPNEADGKGLRARLTSTQLCSYYLGSTEMWQVEHEARRRAAVAAGGTAADVPAQRVCGGLGDTPGFDQRAHLEAVLNHGSPPIKWLRRILFEA